MIKKTLDTKTFFSYILIALIMFFFIININSYFSIRISYAQNNDIYYAKIISSNIKLYKSTNGIEDVDNIYFVIPQSYFVQIQNCENDNYYKATYIDTVGYVKKDEVQCVKGIPQNPFATASFRIFIPGGVELRSSPTQSEGLNTVANLNFLETNLKFYGSIDGEEAISYKSSIWYYCKYIKNGSEIKGYVYSAFCDLLTSIPTNNENLEYIEEPDFSIPTQGQPSIAPEDPISELPSVTQIIIIIAVCLPCIFIIYLLFLTSSTTFSTNSSNCI